MMTAFDSIDGLAAWLDARREIVEEWLDCCEFASISEPLVERVEPSARPPDVASLAFAGSRFGVDGGHSSGGGSSGVQVLAA